MEENQPVPSVSPAPPPIQSVPTRNNSKKFIIMGVVALLIIIIGAIGIFTLLPKPSKQSSTPITTQPTPTPAANTLPIPQFETYTSPKTIPTPPQELYEYSLQTSFTDDEIKKIGQNFLFTSFQREDDVAIFSDLENAKSRGMLSFNTKSGMLSYQSFGGEIKFTGDIRQASKNFLTSLGLNDEAVECNITYQIEPFTDATYVECHRSWDTLGLPLLSAPGLYNVPESTSISQLRLGFVPNDALEDSSIINVSTGQNGKVRPNDFNTATFIVDKEGYLVSLDSTLRFINGKSLVNPKDYQQALLAFSENKNIESFIMPAGGGYTDLKDVFPGNVASSRQAIVNDFEIVYLEDFSNRSLQSYTPVYLLRGTAQLTNGYTVKYVQTTSAVEANSNSLSLNQTSLSDIEQNKKIQIGTFTPTVFPTATLTPNISPTTASRISPTTVPGINTNYDCSIGSAPGGYGFEYTITLPDGSNLVLATPGPGAKHTLFVKSTTAADPRINSLRDQFAKVLENEYISHYNHPEYYQTFYRVSQSGGLAGIYQSGVDGSSFKEPFDYVPPRQYFNSPSPRLKAMYESFEKRAIAIDKGAIDPGPDQNLNFSFLEMTMIKLGEDGNTGKHTCYLSGGSPSLFIYSKDTLTDYNISVTPHTTYADPNTPWVVNSNMYGKINIGNITRNFLYYEFDKSKAKLTASNYGYVINRNQLPKLVEKISHSLMLTREEKTQLHNEFSHAENDIPRDVTNIKITLVDEKLLQKSIPITVSPHIPTLRYHFLFSKPSHDEKIISPQFTAIKRSDNLLLEIGASTNSQL